MTDESKKSKDDPSQKDSIRKEIQEKGKQSVEDKYGIDSSKPFKPHKPKGWVTEQ